LKGVEERTFLMRRSSLGPLFPEQRASCHGTLSRKIT
jgi:hypothetical protein